LSLINVKGPEPRHEKVAIISRTLKALARDMDVPVIALSQLTRDTEGKEPKLNSIRESGAVEQDADVVVFISGKEEEETRDLLIAKQRNGPTGRVTVHWRPDIVRFDNFTREML
jgi:replicative DNA helicase